MPTDKEFDRTWHSVDINSSPVKSNDIETGDKNAGNCYDPGKFDENQEEFVVRSVSGYKEIGQKLKDKLSVDYFWTSKGDDGMVRLNPNSHDNHDNHRNENDQGGFKHTLSTVYSEMRHEKEGVDNDENGMSNITRMRRRSSAVVKYLLSPNESPDNIRIFGSPLEIALEKKRTIQAYFIVHPLSTFKKIWDSIMLLIIMISLIILPLDIAFFDSEFFLPFHIIWDLICIFDIVINFRTGYCVYGDRYELNGKAIAIRYLKGWFPIDCVSSLPLNSILMGIYKARGNVTSGLKALRIVKIIKLINLLKLLRLMRLTRIVSHYEEIYRVTVSIARYVKLVFMMLLIAHWNGCLHFFVPMLNDVPKGSWVELYKLHYEPWYIQYGWSLFKTLSHMLCIGYGRFMPMLLSEAFVTLFTMITGATFYALLITNSVASRVQGACSRTLYNEKLKATNEYLANRKVPDDIRNKVDNYFSQKYPNMKYINEKEILSQISTPLQENIVEHMYQDMVTNITFLRESPPEAVVALLRKTSSKYFLAEDIIVKEGRIGTEMYFVLEGELVVNVKNQYIESLGPGSYFGEFSLLAKQRSMYTIKARTACDILVLSREDLDSLLFEYFKMSVLLQHATLERLKHLYGLCESNNIDLEIKRNNNSIEDMDFGTEPSFMDLFLKTLNGLMEKKFITSKVDIMTDESRDVRAIIADVLESHEEHNPSCSMCVRINTHLNSQITIDLV